MFDYFEILAADFATITFQLLNFCHLPTQFIFRNSFIIHFINLINDFINLKFTNAFVEFNYLLIELFIHITPVYCMVAEFALFHYLSPNIWFRFFSILKIFIPKLSKDLEAYFDLGLFDFEEAIEVTAKYQLCFAGKVSKVTEDILCIFACFLSS